MRDGLTKTYDALSKHALAYYLAVPTLIIIWVLQGKPRIEKYDVDWCMKNCTLLRLKVTISYSPSGEKKKISGDESKW